MAKYKRLEWEESGTYSGKTKKVEYWVCSCPMAVLTLSGGFWHLGDYRDGFDGLSWVPHGPQKGEDVEEMKRMVEAHWHAYLASWEEGSADNPSEMMRKGFTERPLPKPDLSSLSEDTLAVLDKLRGHTPADEAELARRAQFRNEMSQS